MVVFFIVIGHELELTRATNRYELNASMGVTNALKVQPIPPITTFRVHQIKHRTATRVEYDCSRNAVGMQSEKRNRAITLMLVGLHNHCGYTTALRTAFKVHSLCIGAHRE